MGLIVKVNLQFLLLVLFSVYSTAVVITIIDNFTPATAPLFVSNQFTTNTTTVSGSSIGDETLGDERDQILTILPGSANKLISSSVVDDSWSNAFLQNTTGYSIVQYDGSDNSPSLSLSPGLNGLDLTFSASAYAFYFQVTADLPAFYTINVYGPTAALKSSVSFTFDPLEYVDPIEEVIIPFTEFTGTASFTNVFAIELVLNITEVTVKNTAVDSAIFLFGIFGYQAGGSVFYDCNLNGIKDINELPIVGATVTLTNLDTAAIKTQLTIANGTFLFRGLSDGNYQVCITNTNATTTIPASGCTTIVLENAADVLTLSYGYTVATSITAPDSVTIQCGACNTTACTGSATGVGCGTPPSISVSDNVTGVCPKIITRTFSAAGATSVVQTITVQDQVAPTIVSNATSASPACSNITPTLTNWINTRAGFGVTDCNSVTYTDNWNKLQISTCTSVTVTFTATDACGNFVNSTATYSITDTTKPTFTKLPTNNSSQCDIALDTDITAFNSWISNHGFATASDDCTTTANLAWSNDNEGAPSQGCSDSTAVIFTVTDSCGNFNSATATYTISDTQNPTFTTTAQNQQVSCQVDTTAAFNLWRDSHGNAIATDNCASSGALIWSDNFNSAVPSGCRGSATVIFTVTDPCGKAATTSATFSITGDSGPTITTQASPLNIVCTDNEAETTLSTWLLNNGGAVATDSCTSIDWTNTFSEIGSGNCNQATVTFTACNRCSPVRCTSTTTTVSITDNSAPSFNPAPQNDSAECGPNALTSFNNWLAADANSDASDDCTAPQNVLITNNYSTLTPITNGCKSVVTVTFIASDSCGNKSPGAAASFTIEDTIAPSIDNAEDLRVECTNSINTSYNTWRNDHGGASGADNCGTITWTNNGTSTVSKSCSSSQIVVFTATDPCGKASTTSAVFTISDTQAPVISVEAKNAQANCTSDFETSLNNWLTSHGGSVAADDCTAITWSNNFDSLVGDCTQSALVVFTAEDACGFSDTTAATFTVVDSQPPVITTQASAGSVACDNGAKEAFVAFLNNHGGAVAHDACQPDSSLIWTNNLPEAPAQCGTVTVTFSVTDGCGATSVTSAPFSVTDEAGPSISIPAQPLTVECDGTGNLLDYSDWVSSRAGATAIDACSLVLNWTSNATPSGPIGCGKQTVTFTVTDGCLNSARTTATYTVVDTLKPEIFPLASDYVVECDGLGNAADLAGWLAINGGANAVDQCYGSDLTWRNVIGTKSINGCTNYTTYTFTVNDNCGNSASTTARFGITDNFAPNITVQPSPLVIECGPTNDEQIDAWIAAHAGAQAVDDCSGAQWASDYVDEDLFSCYTIPVIFVAYDHCQNVAFSVTSLTVTDTLAPEFVQFPDDIILPCDGDTDPRSTGFPGVQDDCTPHLVTTVTYSDFEFDEEADPEDPLCPGDHIIIRTFSVTDPCGNTNEKNQTITIKIERSSGPCDNDCECPNECCPIPEATECLQSSCLAETCAPSFCAAVLCSCPLSTREVQEDAPFAVEQFGQQQQCEPVYIFVNDDDHEPNGLESGDNNSIVVPEMMQFTNRVPTENDRKEVRKTKKQKRSFLDSILSFFF